MSAGAVVSDLEDLVVRESSMNCSSLPQADVQADDQVTSRNKVYFIAMVESVENLASFSLSSTDETVTYYWVLDCISHGKVLETSSYKVPLLA